MYDVDASVNVRDHSIFIIDYVAIEKCVRFRAVIETGVVEENKKLGSLLMNFFYCPFLLKKFIFCSVGRWKLQGDTFLLDCQLFRGGGIGLLVYAKLQGVSLEV